MMWRKQVGTVTKKEKDQHNNPEKKLKKKGKNKKHLLTSMTSHIIDKTKNKKKTMKMIKKKIQKMVMKHLIGSKKKTVKD